MAELLCGAIPGICRTVAIDHRRINGVIRAPPLGSLGAAAKFFAAPP
jgi:hypothetical protein